MGVSAERFFRLPLFPFPALCPSPGVTIHPPVNLTVRREYVKGTPLEKKTYTDLWHISSGFLMTGCTVDNVPLSQSLLNREIVEWRGQGAVEGRGVHQGPCSNAGIWGASFAPLCAAALQPRAKACPRWISSSFPAITSITPANSDLSASRGIFHTRLLRSFVLYPARNL